MGTNLPDNVVDGQELEASELNKMLVARTNSMLPIDDTTRNETDLAGGLGSATKRYTEAHIDNIKIDGNTMSSTDNDGDINITPNGTGRTKITNIDLFGNYGSEQSKTINQGASGNTTVQATKDLIVVLYKTFFDYGSSALVVTVCNTFIYSDSNANPSTFVGGFDMLKAGISTTDITFYPCVVAFVKKGNYYKVELTNTSTGGNFTTTAYWREIEIGA
jgi:hypothetical protein